MLKKLYLYWFHKQALHSPQYFQSRHAQKKGNALISALLALIIGALGAAAYLESKQLETKLQMAQAEASVLEKLRDAVNHLIFENATTILVGNPINRIIDGHAQPPINPISIDGQLVWQPSLIQLRDMGYLPEGWNLTSSRLNDQVYQIQFRRALACAIPSECNIEGTITIMGAIQNPNTGHADGALIGPILTRLGVDAAVSLQHNPSQLTGWDHSWSAPNPVAGQPAGVLSVRVGTTASTWSAFVRRGDLRDPNLAGNLSVQGNLLIQGGSRFSGDILTLGSIDISNGSTVCSRMDPNGVITLTCSGQLNAQTGIFSQGIQAGNMTLGSTAEPNTLHLASGDFIVRTNAGFVSINATGDLQASGAITATNAITAQNIVLNQAVNEGDTCTPLTLANLNGGGLATCLPSGVYRAIMRLGANRSACSIEGTMATDHNSGEGLLCRSGQWMVASQLLSRHVHVANWVAQDAISIPMPACRDTGAINPVPQVILHAGIESTNDGAILRSATVSPSHARVYNATTRQHEGGAWVVNLRNGANQTLPNSRVLASTYCFYP